MARSDVRTALVTGAGRGLGLEVCRQLGERGTRVLATSRSDPGAKARAALGGLDVRWLPLDVGDEASIASLAASLSADGTPLDVLVNNAAVALDGFDAEVARRTVEVNYLGPLRLTRALSPLLREGGAVVMVSSGMGELSCLSRPLQRRLLSADLTEADVTATMLHFVQSVAQGSHGDEGFPSSAYRVTKAGLNALTRVLSRELAPRRIAVNAVCPGWVRTDMGGPHADRDVREGAASIVWAALLSGAPTGGFYRDGHAIGW